MNCHAGDDQPLQTDRMQRHQPLVVRGEDGMRAVQLVESIYASSAAGGEAITIADIEP